MLEVEVAGGELVGLVASDLAGGAAVFGLLSFNSSLGCVGGKVHQVHLLDAN